ncbi:MAG: hypothetical protein OXU64_03855, partial [Gemmatimonadota bacterium]|nr:hypothetical protein [Gemmatimonadota bacterium]
MMNVLNFLDPSWGIVQVSNPVVQIWRVIRRNTNFDEIDPLRIYYLGGIRRAPEPGTIGTALRPWAPEVPASQWRVQLGLRIAS